MKIKDFLKRVIPHPILRKLRSIKQESKFNSIEKLQCPTRNLRYIDDISLREVFKSDEIDEFWNKSKRKIDRFNIPDATGGVNRGDRRALFYLICVLKPTSVLEIGTHIGASTLHIAAALYNSQIKANKAANLTTVDIRDVNSESEKPWLEFGMEYSPIYMIEELNYDSFVNFVADDSLDFLERNEQVYDFIFLDGNHSPAIVYQEIPAALKKLKPNGVVLLHDYFPEMKPLWSNGSVEKGPFMATERLIEEGADLEVLPLGRLPWKTKLNSHVTSLALLMRRSSE